MSLTVNGEAVTDDAVAQQLERLRESLDPVARLDPRLHAVAEENAVLQVVLRQAASAQFPSVSEDAIAAEVARRRGTPQSTTCSPSERAGIVRALQVEQFVGVVTRQVPRPSPREAEAIYKSQRERFRMPETVHVRHIIANLDGRRDEPAALALITEARSALDAGEAFPRVADRLSDCGGVGGELGWIARGEMVEEFDEVVFGLRIGAVSDVFRTPLGFHIAAVVARRAAHQLPFAEVRPDILRQLHEERRQHALLNHLRGLAARADIRRTGASA